MATSLASPGGGHNRGIPEKENNAMAKTKISIEYCVA
jgi:hypothetical protein